MRHSLWGRILSSIVIFVVWAWAVYTISNMEGYMVKVLNSILIVFIGLAQILIVWIDLIIKKKKIK